MCLLAIFLSTLEKNVYSGPLLMFLNRFFIFMLVDLYEFFLYFGYNLLSDI